MESNKGQDAGVFTRIQECHHTPSVFFSRSVPDLSPLHYLSSEGDMYRLHNILFCTSASRLVWLVGALAKDYRKRKELILDISSSGSFPITLPCFGYIFLLKLLRVGCPSHTPVSLRVLVSCPCLVRFNLGHFFPLGDI